MRVKLTVIGSALAIAIGFVVFLVIDYGVPKTQSKEAAGQAIPAHLADQASVRDAVSASNSFACDMYHQLEHTDEDENLFFSPYSIASALSLVAEGAQGETANQLGSAMHYPANLRRVGAEAHLFPWDTGRINAGMAEFSREISGLYHPLPTDIRLKIETLHKKLDETNKRIEELNSKGECRQCDSLAEKAQAYADELNLLLSQVDQYELHVANTVWAEQTYPLNQKYISRMSQLYGPSSINPADFKHDPEGMRHRMNSKIEEQTRGQIKNMLSQGRITASTRFALVNAIYFKGVWQEVFQKEETKNGDFHQLNGVKSTVPMMHTTFESVSYAAFNGNGTLFNTPQEVSYKDVDNEKKLYPDKQGFSVLELPYEGKEISMIIIVPRSIDGFASLNKKLTPNNIEKWIGSIKQRKVEVYLPKFTLKTNYELQQPLQRLGITRLFKDPRFSGGAELGALSASQNPNRRLYISEALHSACLEVNEEGTTAAAVTFLEGPVATDIPEMLPFIPVFRADQSFLFLIRHKKTNAIIFMGRVVKPAVK